MLTLLATLGVCLYLAGIFEFLGPVTYNMRGWSILFGVLFLLFWPIAVPAMLIWIKVDNGSR